MILKIDSTNIEKIIVSLSSPDGKQIIKKTSSQKPGSQVLLPLIDELLKEKKIKLNKLTSIEVNQGPGSFTGTRVGVAIANALALALDIPVNGKKGKIVEPVYEKTKFD